MSTLSNADKLELFRGFFSGRRDVYGSYDLSSGKSFQCKRSVDNRVLLDHLLGRRPYGVYLLVGDLTQAVAVDFDDGSAGGPMAFLETAAHYDVPCYIERSKSKGFHVWIFLATGTTAWKPRRMVERILEEIDQAGTEVFPKQDAVGSTRYGNFINAPLFGRLVPCGRTVFVDPDTGLRPFPDQWAVLAGARKLSEDDLDELIEINDLGGPQTSGSSILHDGENARPSNQPRLRTVGLPLCVQRMLADGVGANQRVTCFRAGVALKLAGMPRDLTVASLKSWAVKNRPRDGRRIITDDEISSQVDWAYARNYRTYGCEDETVRPFCDQRCGIARRRKEVGQTRV